MSKTSIHFDLSVAAECARVCAVHVPYQGQFNGSTDFFFKQLELGINSMLDAYKKAFIENCERSNEIDSLLERVVKFKEELSKYEPLPDVVKELPKGEMKFDDHADWVHQQAKKKRVKKKQDEPV